MAEVGILLAGRVMVPELTVNPFLKLGTALHVRVLLLFVPRVLFPLTVRLEKELVPDQLLFPVNKPYRFAAFACVKY